MNIQTESTKIFNQLEDNKIEQFEIGSYLFGLDNANSDKDYLVLYNIFKNELNSFLTCSFNYQYKRSLEDIDEDRNYVNIRNFVRNLLNGEQTYFFELIHDSEQMIGSSIEYLYNIRKEFYNYSTIKAYIGLAKRDLKFSQKDNKRLLHAYRGIITAEHLIQGGEYSNNFSDNHYQIMLDIKDDMYDKKSIKDMIEDLKIRQDILRKQVNQKLDKGELYRFMSDRHLKELDDDFISNHINRYEKSRSEYIDLTRFYEIEENPNEIF
ncbi:hypothetical protein PBI_SCTP2_454 [Salicola phage SCTP-2]|nr:hypothetical protein PBI_SCTP2_454 [Salicola phage SCTP-2]